MGDHGPDIAVVFGAHPDREGRNSFNVPEEGVRPELIVEVTSPSMRHNDLTVKVREYWQCQVRYYVIVDEVPRRRRRHLRILGYRHGKRGYRPMRLNAQGRLWLETVQLWLGHEEGRVVCYNQQGQPIADRIQAEQRAVQAEQQAAQAEQARMQAEAELARLQEELRRLRGEK